MLTLLVRNQLSEPLAYEIKSQQDPLRSDCTCPLPQPPHPACVQPSLSGHSLDCIPLSFLLPWPVLLCQARPTSPLTPTTQHLSWEASQRSRANPPTAFILLHPDSLPCAPRGWEPTLLRTCSLTQNLAQTSYSMEVSKRMQDKARQKLQITSLRYPNSNESQSIYFLCV